jgi:DNA-binding PadR family transcriptional regulator
VVRSRSLSGHARALLAALAESGFDWRHGYDLARSTGLRSGTLYPLLIRLEAQGYLEAEWQPPAAAGRPPRHAYRLTAEGRELARREGAAARRPAPARLRGGAALS